MQICKFPELGATKSKLVNIEMSKTLKILTKPAFFYCKSAGRFDIIRHTVFVILSVSDYFGAKAPELSLPQLRQLAPAYHRYAL